MIDYYELYQQFEKGVGVNELSRNYGISKSSLYRNFKRIRNEPEDKKDYRSVLARYDSGESVASIAENLGVSKSSVYRKFRALRKKQREESSPYDVADKEVFFYSSIFSSGYCTIWRVAENGTVDTVSFPYAYYHGYVGDITQKEQELLFNKNFLPPHSGSVTVGAVTVNFDTGSVKFEANNGSYDLPTDLVAAIVSAGKDGADLNRLMNFANRLAKNQSHRIYDRLYQYLTGNGIEITEEGMIHCYKRVRNDYTDIHSGTFDNHPGCTPFVPRSVVNDDENVTCASSGLHVCSKDYLPIFSNAVNDRIVLVEVDPEDVASVPSDNAAKCRCCKYKVLEDVSDQFPFLHSEVDW